MRWVRLKPEQLKPVANSGAFAIGISQTTAWIRPVVSIRGCQFVVDVLHTEEILKSIASIKREMRAGRWDIKPHTCGQILAHFLARFTVHSDYGVPVCTLSAWLGPRKQFATQLSWRELREFEQALRDLRTLTIACIAKHQGRYGKKIHRVLAGAGAGRAHRNSRV